MSSSRLHIPGAANLAKTASRVARASGVRYPVIELIPSKPCLPMTIPRRRARNAWDVILEVAHPRSGQFSKNRVEGGSRLGCQIPRDRAHPVETLLADDNSAPTSPVRIGEVPVGVEAIGE